MTDKHRGQPEWADQVLPSPWRYENGGRPCNVPLVVGDLVVGHCEETVWPQDRRRRPAGTHPGKHKVTWE